MHEVVERAEDEYDFVVIDTPPTSVVSDAIPLAQPREGRRDRRPQGPADRGRHAPPRLAELLGMGEGEGLSSFLSDREKPLADVTRRVPVGARQNGAGAAAETLDVVVSGRVPDNPSGLIDSDRMRDLIDQGEAGYDLVVIDTAPATMVADAIPLISEATAVVVVGRVGRITSAEADALRDQLERIDAPSFGLVANFAPGMGGKYGYGYYK